MAIYEYKIQGYDNHFGLEAMVNRWLSEGWELVGQPFLKQEWSLRQERGQDPATGHTAHVFFQALKRLSQQDTHKAVSQTKRGKNATK